MLTCKLEPAAVLLAGLLRFCPESEDAICLSSSMMLGVDLSPEPSSRLALGLTLRLGLDSMPTG